MVVDKSCINDLFTFYPQVCKHTYPQYRKNRNDVEKKHRRKTRQNAPKRYQNDRMYKKKFLRPPEGF